MPLIPKVTKEMTTAFAKAWDSNGIKVILDATTIQFATDWANIALASFVDDINKQSQKLKAEKAAAAGLPVDAVATKTVPQPAPRKSSIVLTD